MARDGIYRSGKRWRALVDFGPDPQSGKRRQRSKTFDTEAEAHGWRISQLSRRASGAPMVSGRETLAEFLPRWLATRTKIRPSSRTRYQRNIDLQIVPRLGSRPVSQLGAEDIERFKAEMERAGLAPTTQDGIYTVLRMALKTAVRWELLERNPCDFVDAPDVVKKEQPIWTLDQLDYFLRQTADSPLGACWHLAALCGLRRGELLALEWSDIDWRDGLVTVRRTLTEDEERKTVVGDPKTEHGWRAVGLPARCLTILRQHQAEQAERRAEAGTAWTDLDLVIESGDGARLSVNSYNLAFHRQREALGLPYIKPHNLRHSAATMMAGKARIPLALVSRIMGHASISTTADEYGHAPVADLLDAARAIDRIFPPTGSEAD